MVVGATLFVNVEVRQTAICLSFTPLFRQQCEVCQIFDYHMLAGGERL